MGTWGHGYFENDSALDWLNAVVRAGPASLRDAFARAVEEPTYLDTDDGAAAVAAAAVVARASGVVLELPERAEELATRLEVNAELKGEAVLALRAVLGSNSELRQVAGGSTEWRASIDFLSQELGKARPFDTL